MNKLFLTLSFFIGSVSCYAQALELSFNGGVSTNGNPTDNMVYRGDTYTYNYTGMIDLMVNFNQYFQLGLEARVMELSRKSDSVYLSPYKLPIGDDGKKFVYAKFMTSGMLKANGQYPINNYGKIYGGVAIGYGVGRHNSKKLYPSENYRTPDGGKGIAMGAQLGYDLNLSDRLMLCIEGAVRRFKLDYGGPYAPVIRPYEPLVYSITAYNLTLGVRFKLGSTDRKYMRIPAFGGSQSGY